MLSGAYPRLGVKWIEIIDMDLNGRYGLLAGRMNAVNREFVNIENSSLGAKLAKFDRQLSPNLADLGATWAILAST